jgi:diguanylate cyclase (GGDEF)-like protein
MPLGAGVAFMNTAFLIGLGLIWTAYRSLREKPSLSVGIILPAVIWLGLCLIPAVRELPQLRLGIGVPLLLIPISLTARELWLNRSASQIIRRATLLLLGLQVIVMLHRAIRSLLWPNLAFGIFVTVPSFGMIMFDIMMIILILSFSLMALLKDRSERWHLDERRNDFLTGIGNRAHFDESLNQLFHRAYVARQPLALIMIDADAFKEYNDLYGHPSGDRCLKMLADTLRASCRPTDMVARYGGEEFAILLPNADYQSALLVADRILRQVRQQKIVHAHRPGGIFTVSIGVASFSPYFIRTTPAELLEAADRELYKAKQQGRDCICWTGE